eukprot:SAG31_NODE_5757_length_2342_cov_0.963442_1_plen_366_part_00
MSAGANFNLYSCERRLTGLDRQRQRRGAAASATCDLRHVPLRSVARPRASTMGGSVRGAAPYGSDRHQPLLRRTAGGVALLVLGLVSAPPATAHQWFLQLIPNAEDYPQVLALGHQNKKGGGPLNLFGEDFRRHHFKWSLQMCLSDADGDGEPNGVELGDPCCTWREGEKPPRSYSLSHPADPDDVSRTIPAHVNSTQLLAQARTLQSSGQLAALLTSHGINCASSIDASKEDKDFWKFYFKDEAEPVPPATMTAVLSDLIGFVTYPLTHPLSFVAFLLGAVSDQVNEFVDAARKVRYGKVDPVLARHMVTYSVTPGTSVPICHCAVYIWSSWCCVITCQRGLSRVDYTSTDRKFSPASLRLVLG